MALRRRRVGWGTSGGGGGGGKKICWQPSFKNPPLLCGVCEVSLMEGGPGTGESSWPALSCFLVVAVLASEAKLHSLRTYLNKTETTETLSESEKCNVVGVLEWAAEIAQGNRTQ